MDILTSAKIAVRSAAIASFLLALAACANRDVRSFAEGFFHEEDPLHSVNIISTESRSEALKFSSYGRAGGNTEILVSEDELIDLWTLESSRGVLSIASLPDEAAVLQARSSDHEVGVDVLLSAFGVTMQQVIESLPLVSSYGVDIKILATFPGSGHAIKRQHRVDGTPLNLAFVTLIGRDIDHPDTKNPAAQHWANMLSTVVHELLHVEHNLQNLHAKIVNKETAATLFGDCAISRFAIAMSQFAPEGKSAKLTIDFSHLPIPVDGFPDLENGIFAPRLQQFPSRTATVRGQRMATAWQYHYAGGQALVFSDPDAMDPMLRLCDRFAYYVPDFVNGETGLESLE